MKLIIRAAALTGLILLALNCWGLAVSNDLRHTSSDNRLSYDRAIEQLKQLIPGEANTVYRANHIIYQSMDPRWSETLARIPARQNWLLWLAGFFDNVAVACGLTDVHDLFSTYQMTDHHRALQRGIGICSQMALTLAGFLDELGFQTHIVGLSGHIVLQVTLPDGSLLLADPHKGLVMNFGLEYAQSNLDEVAKAYPHGSVVPQLYDPEGNQLVPGPASAYRPKLYLIEKASYYLIWVIPFLLLIPYTLTRKRH